jgi:hypothetical protein
MQLCLALVLVLLTAGCGQASAAGLGRTVKYSKSGSSRRLPRPVSDLAALLSRLYVEKYRDD